MSAAVPVTAFVIALAVIALLRGTRLAELLADRPNERSLHETVKPRIGGIGVMAGGLCAAAPFLSPEGVVIAGAAAVLCVVSALDDARSLTVLTRLSCQLAAAVAVVLVIVPEWQSSLAAVGAVLAIVWMTNAFNFMDGADGLAGGMSFIGFAALAHGAAQAGAADLAIFAMSIACASAAFLAFNFPPARVFLGDAGSVPLGFLAAALGWQGTARGIWPAWFPALVFSPFLVDATVTLVRRLAHRENVWRAHRSHYYQRLVLGGWSHRRLALRAWILMAASAGSALLALDAPEMLQRGILLAWTVVFVVFMILIDRRHPREPS